MAYRLAFIGFGTVGQGTVEILRERVMQMRAEYGFEAQVVAVSDMQKGALFHPDGLDLTALLTAARTGSLANYPDMPGLVRGLTRWRRFSSPT